MYRLIRSPWNDYWSEIIESAQRSLLLCSPYVGAGPCRRLRESLLRRSKAACFKILMITDLSRDNLLGGATDAAAIFDLMETVPNMRVRFLPSLHAKVYIADEDSAVITSSNLTDNGLSRNYEYGVFLSDPADVRTINDDITSYGLLGSEISGTALKNLAATADELRGLYKKADRSAKHEARREFEKRLRQADDEILSLRAAGRAPHAVFMDAVLYLLNK